MRLFNFFKNGRQKDSEKAEKKVTIEKHSEGFSEQTMHQLHDDMEQNGEISDETMNQLLDDIGYVSPIPTTDGFLDFLENQGDNESLELRDQMQDLLDSDKK